MRKTTATTATLPTANPEWGFYGSTQGTPEEKAKAFAEASEHYMRVHGLDAVDARNLLDHRFGRHLADALTFPERSLAWVDANWGKDVRHYIAEVRANRDSFPAA